MGDSTKTSSLLSKDLAGLLGSEFGRFPEGDILVEDYGPFLCPFAGIAAQAMTPGAL